MVGQEVLGGRESQQSWKRKSLVLQMRKWRPDGHRFANVHQLVPENSVSRYDWNRLWLFTSCFFLWLPSPPLYSYGFHTWLSHCLIHWVSEAPCLKGRPHNDSEEQEETGKEASHKGWAAEKRLNVPAMFKPVVSPWRMKEMIDPQSCHILRPSRTDAGQQVLARRLLHNECLAKDLKACIFKFTSWTTLTEESVAHSKYIMDAILSLWGYLNNKTSTPNAGTSRYKKRECPGG